MNKILGLSSVPTPFPTYFFLFLSKQERRAKENISHAYLVIFLSFLLDSFLEKSFSHVCDLKGEMEKS